MLHAVKGTASGTPGRRESAIPAMPASSSTRPERTRTRFSWRRLRRACAHEPSVQVSVGNVISTLAVLVLWCSAVVMASVT